MNTALFWCAHTARGISTNQQNCLCLDKMADVTARSNREDLIKNMLFIPRLVICSRDLYWQWINWTLLCDTMEVSMVSLASLTITQHVFQPPLRGKLELISQKIVSCKQGTKAITVSRFREIVSCELDPMSYHDFMKKYRTLGHQKMRSHMRARYIQFRDIHNRDISGVHCIYKCTMHCMF